VHCDRAYLGLKHTPRSDAPGLRAGMAIVIAPIAATDKAVTVLRVVELASWPTTLHQLVNVNGEPEKMQITK
jgi:hypothetical protein